MVISVFNEAEVSDSPGNGTPGMEELSEGEADTSDEEEVAVSTDVTVSFFVENPDTEVDS